MTSDSPVKPAIKPNKYASAWIMAGCFLPWIWAVFFLPWWLSLIAGVCATGIYLILLSQLTQLMAQLAQPVIAPRRATDDAVVSDERIAKFRGTDGLPALLERWSALSHSTHGNLKNVDQEINHVISQTERAVLDIGSSFQTVINKMTVQMEFVLGLLKTTRNTNLKGVDESASADGADGGESLTDFIRAYEKLLDQMSDKLIHFANMSLELVMGQKIAQESAESVEKFLDEMTDIARQVSTLSLRTSVASGGVSANERAFTEMADKIRDLSQRANEFSRHIRTHMREMKAEIKSVDDSMVSMAAELKDVARNAKGDVSKLTRSMLSKNQEVTEIVENINNLGKELKQDIYKIIMSLQFQDITQQQLQRLKDPLLQEIGQRLDSITSETRVLGKKLQAHPADDRRASPAPMAAEVSKAQSEAAVEVAWIADKDKPIDMSVAVEGKENRGNMAQASKKPAEKPAEQTAQKSGDVELF